MSERRARAAACGLAAAVAAVTASGCYAPYKMPSLSEPHAMVKIRVAYHAWPGPELGQLVLINRERIDIPPPPMAGPGEIVRAVPVRLEATRWDVSSEFFHTIVVPETRTETVTETYQCGFGTSSRTCTRTSTRTRTVMVTRHVTDAACSRAAGLGPQLDAVYLLHYDFYAHDRCSLACFRQWPQPDGSFQNGPCEPPPPAPK